MTVSCRLRGATMTTDMGAAAFWITRPGHGELRVEPVPPPRDGEILVEALYSGISRGTETLVFTGRVPASQHAPMRCPLQAGDFPGDRKSTRLNSSHYCASRLPSSDRKQKIEQSPPT